MSPHGPALLAHGSQLQVLCVLPLSTPSMWACGPHSAMWGCWGSRKPPGAGHESPTGHWMGGLPSAVSSLHLPQALQNMSVPSHQGEGCFPLAKGTPELELSH